MIIYRYLQENCIKKIENLDHLTKLATLNLAQNFVTKVEGLGNCKISTLNLKKNRIQTMEECVGLLECKELRLAVPFKHIHTHCLSVCMYVSVSPLFYHPFFDKNIIYFPPIIITSSFLHS